MAYKALRDAQRMASRYAEDLYDDLESWKKDHGEAMRCRDWEERLALLNDLLGLVLKVRERYDAAVLTKDVEFDADVEEADRRLDGSFEELSVRCQEVASRIARFEIQGFYVDGSVEFRSLRRNIDEIVSEVKRVAKVEGRMGFRGVEMSPTAVDSFSAMLNAHIRAESE